MTKYMAIIVENRFDVSEIIKEHQKLLPDYFDILHIKDEKIKTEYDYNSLMTSLDFWENLPYDKVLIFQHDSRLLREGIEGFYYYAFCGAPIFNIDFPAMNGGLSFRSVKAMIDIWSKNQWNPSLGNEDIAACKLLKQNNYNLPTKEVAQLFSVETIFGYGSLGTHAIERYMTPEQCELIINQYK